MLPASCQRTAAGETAGLLSMDKALGRKREAETAPSQSCPVTSATNIPTSQGCVCLGTRKSALLTPLVTQVTVWGILFFQIIFLQEKSSRYPDWRSQDSFLFFLNAIPHLAGTLWQVWKWYRLSASLFFHSFHLLPFDHFLVVFIVDKVVSVSAGSFSSCWTWPLSHSDSTSKGWRVLKNMLLANFGKSWSQLIHV